MYFLHAKKNKEKNGGFTLLETLVAISIIGIALVVATAALQNSLQTSNFVKDQISAYYLAEDSMEYVLALRDAGAAGVDRLNNDATPSWVTNLLPCITTDQALNDGLFCSTDTFNNTLQNYSNQASLDTHLLGAIQATSPIFSNDPGGALVYSCLEGGATVFEQPISPIPGNCVATKFKRKIVIRPIQTVSGLGGDANAYGELLVTVTISWGSGFGAQQYTISEDLYNWQNYEIAP